MRFVGNEIDRSRYWGSVDIVGYAFASLILMWLAYANKSVSDNESSFDFMGTLVFFCMFLTSYLVIFFRFGNKTYFGLVSLAATSALGTLLYVCGSILMLIVYGRVKELAFMGFVSFALIGLMILGVSFIAAFAVRLIFLPLGFITGHVSRVKHLEYDRQLSHFANDESSKKVGLTPICLLDSWERPSSDMGSILEDIKSSVRDFENSLIRMDNKENANYRNLVAALQLVALPYDKQIAALPAFVSPPDEVALIFDDSFRAAIHIVQDLGYPQEIIHRLYELDKMLSLMSEDRKFWTLEALNRSVEWKNCRVLAQGILVGLNELVGLPNLDFIRFVK